MSKSSAGSEGVVYLVGAGPGDPGLITVRGARLLERAEIVVYDYLSNPRLLSYCPQAEPIYVGKKAAQHSMTQEQINALLVEHGRAGRRVVRLKGGDPFVFGRGGEECEALANAGVRFEVVPGITAAIGAPAYAGIPVTHRDFNSSFTFITGHEKEEEYKDPQAKARGDAAVGASDLDWGVIARLPCVAFYMGVKSLPRICARLVEHGMSPDTPAAAIRWGTMAQQRTIVGTVADLARRVEDAQLKPPALTIIGKVVSLRPMMNWFEARPLFGQTIVVTRTRQQASDLSDQLAALGADVIEAPTIELAPPADRRAVDDVLARAASFDWIVFTSANGVRFARQRLFETGRDVRALGQARLAAIGDATAAAIEEHFAIRPDLCPPRFVAEALADEFAARNEVAGKRFLLLRADIARPVLRERLQQGGAAEVLDLPVYETKIAAALPPALTDVIDAGTVDWVTFTSSSTARNFATLLGPDYRQKLAKVRLASIGPITTQTLAELGLSPAVQADEFNIAGLVTALRESRP
jgi:uroporphyrinogen III methyltransferase/synthase